MDRYKAILKKMNPDRLPPVAPVVESFGFNSLDHELTNRADIRKPFHCNPGERVGRVGIIFSDPQHLFVSGAVHFFNRAYVSCEHEECCRIEPPIQRVACCLLVYAYVHDLECSRIVHDLECSRIVPWVFSQAVFNKLKGTNNYNRLDLSDFELQKSSTGPYYAWETRVIADSASIWQACAPPIKDRLLHRAMYVKESLPGFIGRPMTAEDLAVARRQIPVNHEPKRPFPGRPY